MATTIDPTSATPAPAVPMTPALAAASARLHAACLARRAASDAYYQIRYRTPPPSLAAPMAERVPYYEQRERLQQEESAAFGEEARAFDAWCAAYDAAVAAVPTEGR